MKAMVVLALLFLPLVSHADVILEDTQPSRPPQKKPVKPHKKVTPPATSTIATTTTATTTTAGTTAATTTTATTTTAAPATQTAPSQPAPVPERRKSQFPFAAITTIGIALVVAIAAGRRRANKPQ